MYIITRLIPAFLGCAIAAGIEYAIHVPKRFIDLMSLVLVVVLVASIYLLRKTQPVERLTLLAPPTIFYLGASFALFFLTPWWLQHVVAVFVALSTWAYFEEVYRYVYEPEIYHQHAIERLSSFLAITAMAFNMIGLFALRIFFDVRLIYLLPLSLVIAIFVSTSVLAVQSLSRSSLWSSVAVFALLIMEMTWAVHFLPTNYLVDSLIVTIPFYIVLNLVRHELNGTLNSTLIRRFTMSGIIALSLVLITAQWVI